ncbi:bifunctional folylpolyglutamate synthase/dihydrofolate synthase [Gammaproteobacteria bacterium]|nr:bifunctional folylpolyglutamate synthase/dihydrofolate synthase [Gammaproteobacteria bacterium]
MSSAPDRSASLSAWVDYMQTLHFRSMDLGLDRVGAVWKRLGKPPIAERVVTITGTNGKGSNVAYLESLADASGCRVASYTSPHLVRFNERVRIDGVPLDDGLWLEALRRVEAARLAGEPLTLTYFEFVTLAAFLLMAAAKLDLAVLEVGMGGRLDATNLIDADVVVLTNVSLDHTQWLGDTREAIGYEKAGLFRREATIICGDDDPPSTVLRRVNELGSQWRTIGDSFSYSGQSPWQWRGVATQLNQLPAPSIVGAPQWRNAAVALAAAEALVEAGVGLLLTDEAVSAALRRARLPGRLDVFAWRGRTMLFDVGHNPAALNALRASVAQWRRKHADRQVIALVSFLADKDSAAMLGSLDGSIDFWIGMPLATDRGRDRTAIEEMLSDVHPHDVADGVEDALQRLEANSNDGDLLLVFGSFYLVGDIMRAIGCNPYSEASAVLGYNDTH